MKPIFGIVGMLVVLVVIGMIAKAQLRPVTPAEVTQNGATVQASPGASPAQVTQQVREQVNAAVQSAPKPDEEK